MPSMLTLRPIGGSAPLVLLALFGLWAGCTSPVEVAFDDRSDFSSHRTWDWLPGRSMYVHAPGSSALGLEHALAGLVERELGARGLARAARVDEADLHVGIVLVVRRDYQIVEETGALSTLNTYHETPPYETHRTEMKLYVTEQCRLAMYVTDRQRNRLIWQGSLEDRFHGGCVPHLSDTVSSVLDRFPPR